MEKTEAAVHVSLKNILYATDFSRPSNLALPYILSIARKYGSKVFVVHVIPLGPFPTPSTQALSAIGAQAAREAKEALDALEPAWKNIPGETLICRGDIWNELAAVIKEKEIDLIVTGTHGRQGALKLVMGSVAEKIFRHAPCPVLTVGPNVAAEPDTFADIHTILYPTDFAPASLEAAPYAISLAQENRARLYLLHVTPSPVAASFETSLKTRLRSLIPAETEFWCEPKTFVEFGEAAEKILNVAEELAVDLIVLGPRRMPAVPGATHFGIGTAYKIASRAICPVLSVHRPA